MRGALVPRAPALLRAVLAKPVLRADATSAQPGASVGLECGVRSSEQVPVRTQSWPEEWRRRFFGLAVVVAGAFQSCARLVTSSSHDAS